MIITQQHLSAEHVPAFLIPRTTEHPVVFASYQKKMNIAISDLQVSSPYGRNCVPSTLLHISESRLKTIAQAYPSRKPVPREHTSVITCSDCQKIRDLHISLIFIRSGICICTFTAVYEIPSLFVLAVVCTSEGKKPPAGSTPVERSGERPAGTTGGPPGRAPRGKALEVKHYLRQFAFIFRPQGVLEGTPCYWQPLCGTGFDGCDSNRATWLYCL